jgi:hypothetical protein
VLTSRGTRRADSLPLKRPIKKNHNPDLQVTVCQEEGRRPVVALIDPNRAAVDALGQAFEDVDQAGSLELHLCLGDVRQKTS